MYFWEKQRQERLFFQTLWELWFHVRFTFSCPQVLQFPASCPGSPWKALKETLALKMRLSRAKDLTQFSSLPKGPWNLNLLEDGEGKKEGEQTTGCGFTSSPTTPKLGLTFNFFVWTRAPHMPLSSSFQVPKGLCQLLWLMFWSSGKKEKGWGRWLILCPGFLPLTFFSKYSGY